MLFFSCMHVYQSEITCVTMCDACVTSTGVSEAYKVALGGGLFPWGSN